MNSTHKKNEVLSAVSLIVTYILVYSAADNLSVNMGHPKLVTAVATALPPRHFLYYIPLVVLASSNLWNGVTLRFPMRETVFYVISILFVGFIEEILFRGFLFRAMSKNNVTTAIVVSSLTFGIGHLVNLINGSGAELASNLLQVALAVATGFLFVILFHKSKSLWPSILTHSAINVLSAFADETGVSLKFNVISTAVLCVIAGGYAVYIAKTVPEKE